MGFMRAVFKADGAETDDRYSVSEWWMEPRNAGPGAHHHEPNDEVFYVLEGTASILIGDEWVDGSGPEPLALTSPATGGQIASGAQATPVDVRRAITAAAPAGTFLRIPAGVTHDFENRTNARMGLLNFFIPGGFEQKMPAIVDWFERNR